MMARFKTICRACRRRIRPGDRIRCPAWGVTCHEHCVLDLARLPALKLDDRTRRALEAAERAGFR